jgi:hypothetical protein
MCEALTLLLLRTRGEGGARSMRSDCDAQSEVRERVERCLCVINCRWR